MIKTSGILHQCDNVLSDPVLRSNKEQRAAVLKKVDAVRQGFGYWFRRWHDILHPPRDQKRVTYLGKGDSLYEREGAAVACQMYTVFCNRMHAALAGPEALDLEIASQKVVDEFPTGGSPDTGTAKFNAVMSEVVYHAFYNTTEEWTAHAKGTSGEPIPSHLWRRWLALLGIFPTGNG